MKKFSGKIFSTIEIDPVSDEYITKIPESIINEMEWYEDTELEWTFDGDALIIKEKEEDDD